MQSELLNEILVIHITGNLIPFKGLTSFLKEPNAISGVIVNNKVPDYIPDHYSMRYLLDLISSLPAGSRKLAIIPFTNLQQAMFEIVIEEFGKLAVEINFFKEMNLALSWLHLSVK